MIVYIDITVVIKTTVRSMKTTYFSSIVIIIIVDIIDTKIIIIDICIGLLYIDNRLCSCPISIDYITVMMMLVYFSYPPCRTRT